MWSDFVDSSYTGLVFHSKMEASGGLSVMALVSSEIILRNHSWSFKVGYHMAQTETNKQ